MPTQNSYRFIEDPGHGWLEVRREELIALDIADQISSCSYQNDGMVYLEEDCDLAIYASARAKTCNMTTRDWYSRFMTSLDEIHQDPTPIRNYAAYHPGGQ